MMKNLNTWGKRMLLLAMAFVLALGGVSVPVRASAAERTPAEYVFTDYDRNYHLASFLNGYNVLAFGNVYLGLHCVGALLVQGDYDGDPGNSGFADGDKLPPSFIKGYYAAPKSQYNSRNNDVEPLYVGSSNTVNTWQDWYTTHYSVNGKDTGNNGTTPVYINDNFFNFKEAHAVVKNAQESMSKNSTIVEPDENDVITINIGDNVTIRNISNAKHINIVGDASQKVNTTINVEEGGSINVAKVFFNGKEPAVAEQSGEGTSIVWNFKHATAVMLPTQNWIGHVIAPDADVQQISGNYNGCIICKNLYSYAEGHLYAYTADETSWDVGFTVEKIWVDGDDADGIRPEHIEIQLLADGKPHGKPVRLTAKDGWYHIWKNLPETDAAGKKIVYSVQEVNVPAGYVSVYNPDNQTVVNTHDYETVDISGTKTWLNEWTWSRPWSITVRLYADGHEVASQVVNTSMWGGTNAYSFKGMPKYKAGKEIVYTIHEDPLPGYIGKVEGYDLINTYGVEPVVVSGTKIWDDSNNADGIRPDEVVIQLLANGQVIEEHHAAPNTSWTFTFGNLPSNDEQGNKITYTVQEKNVPEGYTASVDGYDITNTHKLETTSVRGKKTWKDDNDNDGVRPQSITVILLGNMQEIERKTVTAADNWEWEFKDLPKNAGGSPISYIVREQPVNGYTSHADGMNLTNTHENETTEVSGRKSWFDDNNAAGARPESITIRVWDGAKEVASKAVTEADGWAWNFTGLQKFRNGEEIKYTITEDPVPGYETKVSGYYVDNEYTVEAVEVSGKKTWNDSNNQDGKRPTSITINLLADGQEVDSKTVTAADNWSWQFTNLPKSNGTTDIVYTITEDAVAGYESVVNGYDVTNTYKPETTSVSGKKTWNDANNQDGKRPSSITINLLAGGQEIDSKTVTEADNWAWSFTDLPKYAAGEEIVYTITEDAVKDYTTVVTGYNVTNTYETESTSVSGSKTWNDANNQDGKRPASITINLLADGQEVDSKTVTEADKWSWSFTDLPKYADGKEIVYTITEDAVKDYTTVVSGYNVANTYETETTSVSGAKTWNDSNNQDGKRPASITINLFADGEKVASKTVTEADKWSWSFTDLPKYANGTEIVYTITEDAVADYTTVVSGYNVTNTYETESTSVSGSKTWNDANNQDGKRPAGITINLLADGQEIDSKTVTEADNWAWSFTDLPKYADGKEIVYTITEDAVADYTTVVSGYNVANTYETETTSVSGSKTWNDANNQDGKRPTSITINLFADGQEIDRKTVTEADKWSWSFTDLPKYADGKEIVYTITEDAVKDYTTVVSGYNVTNTYETESTSVSGSKTWNDANNQDGKRPASITINLLADGEKVDSKTVTEADKWSWSFTDLPKYANGTEIVYTITEDAVKDYTTVVSGYNVANTYETETTSVSGSKTWNDANNQDGKRPTSITINLLADGEKVDSKTVTEADDWAWSFTDLPKYADGKEIVYTITEDAVADYTTVVSGYNVTNTYETETTSVSGSKTWNDANNQDGKRPSSITINLFADGTKVNSKTVTEADKWSWSFTDLPKYANGTEIVYTITEDAVADYTTVVSGYNVTNTYETESTSVSGSKTWNDSNNQDGKRPTSITINLLADGQEIDSKTVTEADKWSWSFTDLPKYANGTEIVYTITEDAVKDYTTVVSGYNVTNTYETETTSVSGSKTWNDANNQDGKRPASITINLLAGGQKIDSKTVTEADGWSWSFTDLPKYADGKEIVYTITEDAVKDYTTVVSGYNVANTYETETTSVSGSKTWNDANNQDGKRPASITINLFADGTKVNSKTVTEADKWSWSFTDLPKYADGKEIVYTITEDTVADYTTVVSGYNVANTYETETTSVSGSKTWNDANNQDGKRPASITINLLAGGEKVDSKTVTEADKWSWSFTDLPKYANGTEIVYTITEDAVADYTTVVSGYNVTNTYETETTSVSGSKTWNDANNQDGKRPTSIKINLFADGQEIDSKTVTEADKWSWSFTDLPKYADGTEIVYTITEDTVADYTTVVTGYNVANTYETETTSVSGSKTWNDANNQDGKRPASITINLLAGGQKIESKTVTEADKWSWSFTDLPKYADGKEIVYTITEDAVKDYTTVVSGYNVTNTYETETTSVSGSKTWNDSNNQDGKRPTSITINLFADGTKVDSKTVTEADKWSWSFTDLPKYADGKEIVYTITEDAVKDYTTVVSGYNVTNTYETESTSVSGSKTWNDANNQDGKRPASITINLLAGGEKVDSKTVTEADKWSWSFTDLPKYADGKEIVYTITEDAVADYTTVVSGYNVTNTYETESTSVSGSKTWNDANNQDGKRPTSITINLLAGGEKIDSKTVTEADKWSWSFTDLPKYADGKEIVYTITEDAVKDYTTVVSGYNVTNTYETETTSVSGSKTWNDANNQDGKRPSSITINLLAGGQKVDSKTVTEADGWSWSFTDLPKYADGKEIVYTITEDAVKDYTTVVSGYNVANTYETETTSVSGSKTWNDANNQDGKRPASITINLLADGEKVDSKTVTEADNWAWSFTDLPKYAGGKEIKYTITEDPVPEYTTMVVDHDVINTHETEKTSISGRKLWFDDDDVRGLRPESITIRLLANGREVRSLKVTAADNWMWRFTDLPMNENGKPIKYTITEDVVPDYTTRVVGYNVYNTYDRTSFSVTKVWEGREGGPIKLTVYADGNKMNPQPAFTRYGDMYVWEDLLLYNEDGDEIVYSVTEEYMDGYMTIYENVGEYAGETDRVYDGGTIINRGVVNIFVRKVWEGYEEDEEKPEIELVLYCNGVATDVPMPEPDKYGWYKYYNLPAQVDGEDARYTVRETKRIGFMAVYTSADGEDATEGLDGGTITNLKMPATGDNTPLLLWTVLMAAAGAGLVLISRRRRA